MKQKVLIVDDEPFIVEVLSIRLAGLGYAVAAAYDGEAGLAAAKREKPDLALVDLGLPKLDGGTLCRRIKADEALKHTKVIILTGRSSDEQQAAETGADLYISKPYEWEYLRVRLQGLLA